VKVLVVDVEPGALHAEVVRHLHDLPVEIASVVACETTLRTALSRRDYCAVVVSREAVARTNELLAEVGVDAPCVTATPESLPRVRTMLRALGEPVLPGGEDFYRWVMESGNLGVWVIDASGRTRFVNPALAQMFRTTAGEMKGRSVLEFLDEDQHAIVRQRSVSFKDGQRLVAEYRYRRSDGTYFTGLLESTPLFEAGTFAGGIAMVMDISEWKAAEDAKRASEERVEAVEAQLRQSQKMEAVGRLAGGIAHDFNNMLSVILGYGDSLLDRLKHDAEALDDMQEILAAGRRASELTRQLLLFSRRHLVERSIVNLAELLAGMEKMLERMVGEDVETVCLPYRGKEPPLVLIDKSGIEMVLLNLVVNARDAMPNGGRLTIALDDRGPTVVLRVLDSGHGMDEATRARAFDPFFTTKAPGKGTGLGLSTAYGIVEQAGGKIHIESAVGEGTVFINELPRATKEGKSSTPPPPSRGRAAPRATILLVEDEDQVRAVARRALERYGHRVIEARTPMEALDKSREFELLLTDVIMPQMSGAELARRLLAERPTLKVVFMSGYTDDLLSAHGVESASVSYLQKPFTPADLSKKVREVLEGP
jgi:PAS domain S-box-containing protein